MRKRIISLILVFMIVSTSMLATITVEAAPKLDMNKIKGSITTLLKNKVENMQAYYNIASELIKYTIGTFADVKESDWFAKDLAVIHQYGIQAKNAIISGMPNGKFNAAGTVTKSMFTKMLVEAMGYKKELNTLSFDDTREHWAKTHIETAVKEGIIIPSEIGQAYNPDAALSRVEMAKMLCLALKLSPSTNPNPFLDMEKADGYVTKAFEEYLLTGKLQGDSRYYEPNRDTTRAEAVAVIARALQYKENPDVYKAKMRVLEPGYIKTKYKYFTNAEVVESIKRLYDTPADDRPDLYDSLLEEHMALKKSMDEHGWYDDDVAKSYNYDVDAFFENYVRLVKSYYEKRFNVDYRALDDKEYLERLKDYDINWKYFANKYEIPQIKANKVIAVCEFMTDSTLHGPRYQRGTLRIKFDKNTKQEYITKKLHAGIKPGKWYEVDIEIDVELSSKPGEVQLYGFDIYRCIGEPREVTIK